MKTTLIILSLICTDFEQNIFCYKTVVKRTSKELRRMSDKERMCDTFTLYSNHALVIGQQVINKQ